MVGAELVFDNLHRLAIGKFCLNIGAPRGIDASQVIQYRGQAIISFPKELFQNGKRLLVIDLGPFIVALLEIKLPEMPVGQRQIGMILRVGFF